MRRLLSRCKECLLRIIAVALYYSGALRPIGVLTNALQPSRNARGKMVFPFLRKAHARNVQILGYHRVNDSVDPFFPATPTRLFAQQMEYLATNCNVLSLEVAIERMALNDVPDSAIVVTLDDGYRDNYLNALPILQRCSIPATVFLATDAVGSGRVLWHDRVFSAFRETKATAVQEIGDNSTVYPLRTLEERLVAQTEALKLLRSVGDHERSLWIDRLVKALEVEGAEGERNLMLTWDDVRRMSEGGIAFGSHTVTHPILSRLCIRRAEEEIRASKETIERELRSPVRTFAYPSGRREDFDEHTKGILKDAGYVCAVTAIFGSNGRGQDVFELRRGTPWEGDLPSFAMKLAWYRFRP